MGDEDERIVYIQGNDLTGVKPPTFNWEKPQEFKNFKRYCEIILSTSSYATKKPEDIVNHILLWMGPDSIDIFDNLPINEADRKDPKKVWDAFELYFEPKTNFRLARFDIHDMKQGPTEPIDTFMNRLKVQAKKCEYTQEQLNDVLIDQIIKGTAHMAIRKKLLDQDPKKLTLDIALQHARTIETTQTHMKHFDENQRVDAVAKAAKRKSSKSRTPVVTAGCNYCGQPGHHAREQCKAKDQECRKCHKIGHFAKVCRSTRQKQFTGDAHGQGTGSPATSGRGRQSASRPKRGQAWGGRGRSHQTTRRDVNAVVNDDLAESEEFNTVDFDIHYMSGSRKPQLRCSEAYARLTVRIRGRNANLHGKADTGAQGNILPIRTFRNMFPRDLDRNGLPTTTTASNIVLTAYNGTKIKQFGTINLQCRYGSGDWKNTQFFVVDTQGPVIFGLPTCLEQGLVKMNCGIHADTNAADTQSFKSAEDLRKRYPDRFKGIGKFPGTCKLTLKPNAQPVIHAPRKAPIQLRDKIKAELQRMVELDVIRPVNEPTDWVSSITYVHKPDGSLRICLDPKDLNSCLKRGQHHIPTLEELTHKFANAKYFSKLDAKSGYWACELDPESQLLTTFNSPFGRHCFKRLAFGLSVSQDIFQAKMDEILDGLEGVVSIADDITVFGETQSQHDERLAKLMARAREKGLIFNYEKCHIGRSEVTFFGNVYSAQGVRPDPAKVEAIQQIKRPTNVKELQSFLGLVTYLGPYIKNLSELTAPLRTLLHNDSDFQWNSEQELAFERLKKQICKSTTLSYFQPAKPTIIQVDASQHSLGAALIQDGRPIAFASKSLTPTEQRYANIERELLACVFGAERFHTYIYGSKFKIESDHRPLDMISKKNLTVAPPRLQRMLLRLQKYDYDIVYKPGKEMILPDSLSRLPKQTKDQEIDLKLAVCFVQFSTQKLNELREATVRDEQLNSLMNYIVKGFPEKGRDLPFAIRNYWSMRDQLSIEDGVILKGNQVVIPEKLRRYYLDKIHESHQGITRTQQRAKSCVYWPGIYQDIDSLVSTCKDCQENQRSQTKESLDPIVSDIPNIPWHTLGTDFFQFENNEYLIVADYFSKYMLFEKMSGNPNSGDAARYTTKEIFL